MLRKLVVFFTKAVTPIIAATAPKPSIPQHLSYIVLSSSVALCFLSLLLPLSTPFSKLFTPPTMPSVATVPQEMLPHFFFTIVFHHHKLRPTCSQGCTVSASISSGDSCFPACLEAGIGVGIHPTPWCCLSTICKLCQSLCPLMLPFYLP